MEDKKILVVEDDAVLREVLIEKLKKTGYQAVGAEDGEEAMEKLHDASYKPDIILLDILMPKKDGMQVLQEIHDSETLKKIPVIIISNSGQPVEIEKAKELGARDFLIKAVFDPGEVLEKVNLVLCGAEVCLPNDTPAASSEGDSGAVNPPEGSKTQEHTQSPKEDAHKAEVETKGATVLVVEDDKFLRELLVRKLFSEGFDVKSAIDSKGAFDVLAEVKPKIILLDLILPGEDGFTILGKIKEKQELVSVPVVILSNLGQKEDVDKAMKLGAVDFMVKANFTLDEIVAKVRSVLKDHPSS